MVKTYAEWQVPEPREYSWAVTVTAKTCPYRYTKLCIHPANENLCDRDLCPLTVSKIMCDGCPGNVKENDND